MLATMNQRQQIRNPLYGQLVIGPPGSGKTTYCHKITEFYKELERKVAVVNLDPGNEQMEYNADIDIVSRLAPTFIVTPLITTNMFGFSREINFFSPQPNR